MAKMSHKGDTRYLLFGLRQVLIMALSYLEEYLDCERSVIPKEKRERA